MKRHWSRPEVNLIEPFVTVDLASGQYIRNHPAQVSDASQITATTADDTIGACRPPQNGTASRHSCISSN